MDRSKTIVVVEVRGRAVGPWRPVKTLSAQKQTRLKRLADGVARRFDRPVRIEFIEMIGEAPPGWKLWCFRIGISLKLPKVFEYSIDDEYS